MVANATCQPKRRPSRQAKMLPADRAAIVSRFQDAVTAVQTKMRAGTPDAVEPVPEKPAPIETAPNGAGRGPNGQFRIGNPGGPGNPFSRRLGKMRTAFLDATSVEDVQAVARKLRDQVLAGDVAAATVYLQYAIGRPRAAVEPDRLDLDEWRLLLDSPCLAEIIHAMSAIGLPADAASVVGSVVGFDDLLAKLKGALDICPVDNRPTKAVKDAAVISTRKAQRGR
jgi:hypothetical protein